MTRDWARGRVEQCDDRRSSMLQQSLTEWQLNEVIGLLRAERARARRVVRAYGKENNLQALCDAILQRLG